MATIKQYVVNLLERQRAIASKMGSDVGKADKESRVLNLALLVLLAAVIKTLTDKGVITDAELLATLNSARDDAYPDEPSDAPKNGDI